MGIALAGCSEPALCQREVVVSFPQTAITADVDAITPGVQSDITVQTTLLARDLVSLDIFGGDGAPHGTLSRAVGADGSVVFAAVTVTTPRVTLRASGSGICGDASAQVTLDVVVSGSVLRALR